MLNLNPFAVFAGNLYFARYSRFVNFFPNDASTSIGRFSTTKAKIENLINRDSALVLSFKMNLSLARLAWNCFGQWPEVSAKSVFLRFFAFYSTKSGFFWKQMPYSWSLCHSESIDMSFVRLFRKCNFFIFFLTNFFRKTKKFLKFWF